MRQSSITVVLPTHNRPASLARVLDGLAKQRNPGARWDIVVIDNDAPPGTAAGVVSHAGLPVPARVVLETELGASRARNRGVAEATGDILAFIDDDVVPSEDWLARLVEPIREQRCDGVGGRVELDPSVPRPDWMPSWLLPYLAAYSPADHEVDLRDLAPDVLVEPYLLTANAAFTADILDRCGGFDPRLGPRRRVPLVNDDLALCRRVLAVGGTIRYTPAARVVHELPAPRLRRRYMWRRLYAQGRSDWMLDHDKLAATRSAGAAVATVDFARLVVHLLRTETMPGPRRTFLWSEVAKRTGFLRESLAHLAHRRPAARTGR